MFPGLQSERVPSSAQPVSAMSIQRLLAVRQRRTPATDGGAGAQSPTIDGHRHRHGQRIRPEQLGLGRRRPLHRHQAAEAEDMQPAVRSQQKQPRSEQRGPRSRRRGRGETVTEIADE